MKDKNLVIKCLDTLKNLRKEEILDQSINRSIDSTIYKVENIMNDNKIKVAILGEFSSGKSTFINAFLRKQLLSYADEPTTAINTYITYGEREKTTIYYNNGSSKVVNSNDLEKYTKEGKVAKNIDRVNIEYNNRYLKKGITIIDTPGANIDNHSHNVQRSKAMKECSMGIFLISVKSLTSKSFIDFLKNNKDSLGKFIFVISKCDMLEEDDIDIDANKKKRDKLSDVINYVKSSITQYSGIKAPRVYAISAYNFLNNKSSSILDVKKSFLELESDIENIHKKDRTMLVLLEMLKVLNQICPNIRDILNDKNKLCEYEIKKVNGEIESFDRFVYNDFLKLKKSLNNNFYNEKLRLSKRIGEIKQSNLNSTIQQIDGISTMGGFKSKINGISINGLQEFANRANEEVQSGVNHVGHKEFKEAEGNFKEYFMNLKRTYRDLGIERALKIKAILKNFCISILSFWLSEILIEVMFRFSGTRYEGLYWDNIPLMVAMIMFVIGMSLGKCKVDYHIPYERKHSTIGVRMASLSRDVSDELTEGHGFGAGVVIGALAGGPIGAAIGAGIGGVLGALFLGGRLETLKSEFRESLKEEMNKAEVNMNIHLDDMIAKKRNSLIAEYKNYVGENMGLYKELLDGIYNYNNNKFVGLSKSNNTLKNYLGRFEAINKEIGVTIKNVKSETM